MNRVKTTCIALSSAWIALIVFLYLQAYWITPPLQEILREDCPSMEVHVISAKINHATISRSEWVDLIAWHDRDSGVELSLWSEASRRYIATMSCTQLKRSAISLSAKIEGGEVKPELRVKYSYMAAIALAFPLILLAVGCVFALFTCRARTEFHNSGN